jgi:Sulfotransferase family
VTVTLPEHIVRVDQPLLLISQAQRSGGTLLLRLLDGHPECNVVPFQLRGLDAAAKRRPRDLDEAWQAFYDLKLAARYEAGHRQRKHDVLRDEETFPFELQPELQRAIFDACAGGREPTPRNLFDCYFTSYFNAWLDYVNLRIGEKRWVVGFEPGVAGSLSRRTAIRNVYPDGLVVSIVRDPWSWYASARRWEPRWAEREAALDHWCHVAGGTLKWRRQHGKQRRQVRIVTFENLLTETEKTMRRIAGWIGIEFRPELTRPTFNGRPIRANTSFSDVQAEVSTAPLDRARNELSADDVDYIHGRAGELYRTMAKKSQNDWTKPVD